MHGSVDKLKWEFVCKVWNNETGRVEMGFHLEPQRLINLHYIFNAGHALQGFVLIIHLSTSECAALPLRTSTPSSSTETADTSGYQRIGAGMWLLTDTSPRTTDPMCSQLASSDKFGVQVKPKAGMINSSWLFLAYGFDIDSPQSD